MEKIGLEAVFDMGNFDKNMSKYTNSIDKANKATDKAGGTFAKQFGQMQKAGLVAAGVLGGAVVVGATAATGAMVKFATDGISAAQDLEAQVSGIAAILGVPKAGLKDLNDLILELGIDPKLKVDATEAADAIELLARNGMTMSDIMAGGARNTVLLANATGADFGTAADIATDAMAIFNIEAKDMQSAVDGIVSVTNKSKFGIDDYRLALANGGAAAMAAGVTFDEFNTSIAAISPLFASGQTAGTGLKNFLQRLVPTTLTAKDAMFELGLITEDGANVFFDASGQMKDMDDIAQIMQDTFKDLSEEQRTLAMRTIFGNDALGAAIGFMQLGANEGKNASDAFNELAKSMGEVDAEASAGTRMDNLAGSLEILRGIIDTIKIRVGQAFLPALKDMADAASAFLDDNADAIVAFFGQFSEWLAANLPKAMATATNVIKTLSAAFGEVVKQSQPFIGFVIQVAGFLRAILGPALVFVQAHAKAFAGAFTAIAAVLAAPALIGAITTVAGLIMTLLGPVGLVLGAVGLLGAAWATDWNGIQTKTREAVSAVKKALTPLGGSIRDFAKAATEEIGNFMRGQEEGFEKTKTTWSGVVAETQKLTSGVVAWVQQAVPKLQEQFGLWAVAAYNWIVTVYPKLLVAFWTFVANFLVAVSSAYARVYAQFYTWGLAAYAWLTEALPKVQEAMNQFVTYISTKISEVYPQLQAKFMAWGAAAWGWVLTAIPLVQNALGVFVSRVRDKIDEVLPQLQEKFTTWATAAWEWVSEAVPKVQAELTSFTGAVRTKITGFLPQLRTAFAEWTTAAYIWVTAAILGIGRTMTEFVDSVRTRITDALPTLTENFAKWAVAGYEWITTSLIPNFGTYWGQFVSFMIGLVINMTLTMVNAMFDLGQAMVNILVNTDWAAIGRAIILGIAGGIAAIVGILYTLISTVAKETFNAFVEFNWSAAGERIMSTISRAIELSLAFKDALLKIGTDAFIAFIGLDWTGLARLVLTTIKNGISSFAHLVVTALKDAATSGWNAFKNVDWSGLGSAVMSGIESGLRNGAGAVRDFLSGLATGLINDFKARLGISSPSKVFASFGEDIVEGLLAGLSDGYPAVLSAAQAMAAGIQDAFTSGSDPTKWLPGFAGRTLSDVVDAYGDLRDLVEAVGGSLDIGLGSERFASKIDNAQSLLELMQKLRLDPRQVFGDLGANIYDVMNADNLPMLLQQGISAAFYQANDTIARDWQNLINTFDMQGWTDKIAEQTRRQADLLSQPWHGDFTEQYVEKASAELDRLNAAIQTNYEYLQRSPGSTWVQKELTSLLDQRDKVLDTLTRLGNANRVFDTAIFNQRWAELEGLTTAANMFSRAAEAGVRNVTSLVNQFNLADIFDPDNVRLLQGLEADLFTRSIEAQANIIRGLRNTAGLFTDLGGLSISGPGSTFYDSFVAKLSPMLDRIKTWVGYQGDLAAYQREYSNQVERALRLQQQSQQLDFLQQQLDLLQTISDEGLDAESILGGVTLGLNTSIEDLLSVTERLMQALINKANDELQIQSPSKVFAGIGQQVMAGLAQGLQKGAIDPLAMMHETMQMMGAPSVYNRSVQLHMGGVTINTPMDEAIFATNVLRVVEGAL